MRITIVKTGLLAFTALTMIAAAPQDTQNLPGISNFTLPPSLPPAPTPSPTPAGPVITLPTLAPAPTASATPRPRSSPTPRATPTPRASASPASPRATASPAPSPSPSPSPVASPSATPSSPAPIVVASPAPTPTASPSPPAAAPSATEDGGSLLWPIVGGLLVLALLVGAGALFWRRRRDAIAAKAVPVRRAPPPRPPVTKRPPAPETIEPVPETPSFWTPAKPAERVEPVVPEPASPPSPPPPPPSARPRIEIAVAPRRAGLNLLSATAEVELVLRNEGDAAATDIALDVRLINAQSAQEAELGAFFAAAMAKSAVPPFEIAAGEEQSIRTVATLPRESIAPLIAAGRPMFVPMITVDVRYDRGDDSRAQTAAAFMIGIVRDGSDKLAPFWLDTPTRMYDTIAARPHAFSVHS